MRKLTGRTAIVTGAVGGIGPFISRELAKEGLNLALVARTREEMEQEVAEIQKMNVRVIAIQCDVRDLSSLETVVTKTIQEFGKIDVLVNNAGINNVCPYDKLSTSDIERIIRE